MSWSPLDDLDDQGRTPAEVRNQSACQCSGEMPGRCPGPSLCPMCAPDESDDEAPDFKLHQHDYL